MLIGGDEDDDDPLDARSRSLSLFLTSAVVDSHKENCARNAFHRFTLLVLLEVAFV